jgi:tripartite ATP-independent transporter DctP family solute receptor
MQAISRRGLLGTGGTALTLPLLPRYAKAAEFTFKVAHGLAINHPTNIRLNEAAAAIAKDSDGRLELKIFPTNQLGGESDLLNQVRSGAVEVFLIGGLVISSLTPIAALDGTGFAFRGYEQVWPAMDGALGAFIREALAKVNLYVPATIWDLGFRQVTNSTRPVRAPGDIVGMKIRIPGAEAYANLFKALGASPTSLQFPEVYSALQTHLVDGQENPLALIATSRFYEVQKYCSLTNHMWNGFWVLINARAWRRLPAPLQEIAEKHLNASGLNQRADLAAQEVAYRKTMEGGGVKFNDTDRTAFQAALSKAGYYANARKVFGEKAWSLLETAGGAELG